MHEEYQDKVKELQKRLKDGNKEAPTPKVTKVVDNGLKKENSDLKNEVQELKAALASKKKSKNFPEKEIEIEAL